jgi:hypothetical protein
LGPLIFVASETNFRLCRFVAHFVMTRVHFMARCTGYVTALVDATFPMRALGVFLVARQAGFIALGNRRCTALTKGAVWCRWLTTALVRQVGGAIAVAADARRSTPIGTDSVSSFPNGQHSWRIRLVVAGSAFRVAIQNKIFRRIGCICRTTEYSSPQCNALQRPQHGFLYPIQLFHFQPLFFQLNNLLLNKHFFNLSADWSQTR